jgi:hypothetical protein
MTRPKIVVPDPTLQIAFSSDLREIRRLYLQEALFEAVGNIAPATLDAELGAFVQPVHLQALARRGLRGELVFPVPTIINCRPRLLGYYRLLLGLSQKAFYQAGTGLTGFKALEEKGIIPKNLADSIPALCKALVPACAMLLEGLRADAITKELLDDLTLLTVGPQLRGGANVKKGADGIRAVFELIHRIVEPSVTECTPQQITLLNAAKRNVRIAFAQDPDIVILESIGKTNRRNIVAIEVKGGTDFSNIHNRIGEAEKSHQKARRAGFVECWTVINVENFDEKQARKESPSTNKFYRLSDLVSGKGDAFEDFRDHVFSMTGITGKPRRKRQ